MSQKTATIQTNFGPEIFEIGSKLTELQPFEIRNFDLGHPVFSYVPTETSRIMELEARIEI